jgi:hypothetical protein
MEGQAVMEVQLGMEKQRGTVQFQLKVWDSGLRPIVSSIVRNFPSGSHRTKLHYAWLRYAEESLS